MSVAIHCGIEKAYYWIIRKCITKNKYISHSVAKNYIEGYNLHNYMYNRPVIQSKK